MCDSYRSPFCQSAGHQPWDEYDVLIVGGGITGAEWQDTARRGLNAIGRTVGHSGGTALVHPSWFTVVCGTWNKENSLWFSKRCRATGADGHCTSFSAPMPFLPVFEDSRRGMFTINIGMWLYDGLSLFRSPNHKSLTAEKSKALSLH